MGFVDMRVFQDDHHSIHLSSPCMIIITTWGAVKIMVPIWVPIIIRGLIRGPNLGDPKRDHNFDSSPHISGVPTFTKNP